MKETKVTLTKQAIRDLDSVPDYIERKLFQWADLVHKFGIDAVRVRPGYHDEPLKGDRIGQRSIRLNQAYRAIYVIDASGKIQLVEVIEVTKHKY